MIQYNNKCIELLSKKSETINPNELLELFDQLHALDPKSFSPFYPLLTIFLRRFEKPQLQSLLKKAKECDQFHSYIFTVNFLQSFSAEHTSKKQEILEVLREIYSSDLVLPSLSECGDLDLSEIRGFLEGSLHDLASNQPRVGLTKLLSASKYLVGQSIIHSYQALAWAQNGNSSQAKTLLYRSICCLDKSTHQFPPQLVEIIKQIVNKKIPTELAYLKELHRSPASLLEAYINMVETKQLDISLARAFITIAAKNLRADVAQLPFAFFGIQYILARLDLKSIHSKSLIDPLNELMIVTATICHQTDNIDPWILENFQKITGEQSNMFSFIINLDKSSTYLCKEPPSFRFTNALDLEDNSKSSIATHLTKQLHHSIIQIQNSSLDIEESDKDTLKVGFLTDDAFNHLNSDLRAYLNCPPSYRPSIIDEEFLQWGKFCSFASAPPSFLADKMDQEINANYYPSNFLKKKFENDIETIKTQVPLLSDKCSLEALQLAVRDTLLASHDLAIRSKNRTIQIGENSSLYSLYLASKQLFNWRRNESFKDWGERLKNQQLPEGDKKTQEFLKIFLQFWIDFHEKTEKKNAHIHSKNEKSPPPVKLEKWFAMIKNNKPKDYPFFSTFPKDLQQGLTKTIKKKNTYFRFIESLKDICLGLNNQLDNFTEIVAAGLLVNADSENDEGLQSAFMKDENQALHLCQILLDVSLDRCVRRALVIAELDPTMATSVLPIYLNNLLSTFHGPEVSLFGRGPINSHYNIKVTATDTSLVKNRIYFNAPD